MANIEWTGSDLLAMQLAELPAKVQKRVESVAVKRANQLAVQQLKAAVPKESGALQKSIKQVIRKYKGGKIVVGITGPDTAYTGYYLPNKRGKKVFKKSKVEAGKKGLRRPGKYAHLAEYGTVQRRTAAGESRGSVTGTRFTEKVTEQIQSQLPGIIAAAVREAAM